jgi:hypothetical protein
VTASAWLLYVQRKEWDLRSVECPVCRARMPHAQLERVLSPDEVLTGHPDPALHASGREHGDSVIVALPEGEDAVTVDGHLLHSIQMHREKARRIVEAQALCGGLIQTNNVR